MHSQELQNLTNGNRTKPNGLGRTILAIPSGGETAVDLFRQVKEVWEVVAAWGTWQDDDLGDWPADEECIGQLPDWFKREPTFSLQAWISDLHDREWTWWSGNVVNGNVKVDLSSQSLPISTWMLEVVFEVAGGCIVYRGSLISDSEAIALGRAYRSE